MNNRKDGKFSMSQRLAILVSALLLAGAGYEGRQFGAPPGVGDYRARVNAARLTYGLNLGDWQGVDQPVEIEATKLLRPNFIISRRYHNVNTGEVVDVLFVNCQDARDTISHFPPVCYKGAGWSLEQSDRKDWALPSQTVHGTEYSFIQGELDSAGKVTVDDFFVLPGEGSAPDRDAVIAAARNMQRRFYGVGQVQLAFAGDWKLEDREQAFHDLVGPMEQLIQAVETIGGTPAVSSGGSVPSKVSP